MNKLKRKHLIFYILSILIIFIWLGISGIGGSTFSKLNSVYDNSQAAFLPASSESTKVQNLEANFLASNKIPAVIIYKNNNVISPSQANVYLVNTKRAISSIKNSPSSLIGPIYSNNKEALEFLYNYPNNPNLAKNIDNLRTYLNKYSSNVSIYVTGPAGLSADLSNAFGGIDGILLLVALISVFVILLIVYRSFLLPVMVLITAMIALSGSIYFVYLLAKHGVIKLNGESQGILSILVIGAATDYSLLLVSRFRENLRHNKSKIEALIKSLKVVIEPIAASAGTVIVALLCLMFSDLNSNKSLGPVGALGIFFSFVSVMTFLSAILLLFGRKIFWPIVPKYTSKISNTSQKSATIKIQSKLWGKIGKVVGKNYRKIWIGLSVILLAFALGVLELKANGVSNTSTILGKSNAVSGQKVVDTYFKTSSGSPVILITNKNNQYQLSKYLKTKSYLNNISTLSYNANNQLVPISYNNQVLIQADLNIQPDSLRAQNDISKLRSDVKTLYPSTLIGGTTAILLDTNNTAKHDLYKIIPIVLIVILIILILLLRAFIAPIVLILSVILSFLATMGISALVFNHIFHFPGADPAVPLFGFIFLVALGVDYNIFLMTRVREESKKHNTPKGVILGLANTGNVITSAGIVLAATFSALAVIPILFLVQLAFIVALGVLVDTIIVRSLLVPSLAYDIGSKIWWPFYLKSDLGKK